MPCDLTVDGCEISFIGRAKSPDEEMPKSLRILADYTESADVDGVCERHGLTSAQLTELIRRECMISRGVCAEIYGSLGEIRSEIYARGQAARSRISLITDMGSAYSVGVCEGQYTGYMESLQIVIDLVNRLAVMSARTHTP